MDTSTHSSKEEKRSSRSQISPGELIEAIFTVPGRLEEEPKVKRHELGANRSRVPYQKPVLKPLEDVSSYSIDLPVKIILNNKGIILLSLFIIRSSMYFQNKILVCFSVAIFYI
jgi:hypothetical protein